MRRLSIAVMRDIHRTSDPRDLRTSSDIDRDARKGRELWAGLGAFPWSLYGPSGRLPAEWWRDEMAIEAWQRWLD